jgi:hypothetical protein
MIGTPLLQHSREGQLASSQPLICSVESGIPSLEAVLVPGVVFLAEKRFEEAWKRRG